MPTHVITRKRLRVAIEAHPQHAEALQAWYRLMKTGTFANFAQLKAVFSSVDKVGEFCVFNIAGNPMRIVAAMHFNRSKCFIRHVATHAEYDKLRLQ